MLEIELRVPRWATETGAAPKPKKRETFVHYCLSLGAPYSELTEGLTDQTADLANGRLATWIQYRNREKFKSYTRAWLKTLVPPERLRDLDVIGENIRIGRWT
jgi:hypothetical protein